MKFIKRLLFIIIVLIVLIVIGRNIIVRYGAPVGARVVGIKMSLGKVNIGLTDALIGIKDIQVKNPKGFPKGNMVEIKEIYIDPEVAGFLKDKIHLVEIRFDLDNLVIIKNENGEFNFNKLTQAKEKQDGEQKPEEEEPTEKGKKKEIQIDLMKLKLGTVVYKDYSDGPEPKISTFKINLDEEYEDITNPAMIGSIIFSKIMANTTLSSLTGINMSSINDAFNFDADDLKHLHETVLGKDTVNNIGKGATKGIKKASDAIKNIF